ncbi:MAG: SDR family oxidoreductase [Gammaproteobacteria bacterium]
MSDFRVRRCLMAVLVLIAGATLAPIGSALAAAKKDDATADKIVISGASGQLAGEAISELLERGVPITNLILVTRTPEKLSSFAERGAQVRSGDFSKPQSLPAAFAGGRQLLLISTSGAGGRLEQHTNAISAARKSGIRHIVYTSFVNATDENPATITRDHRLTEEALKSSGVPYTILRNQLYSDGLVARGAEAVASGLIISNSGPGKWAPVAREDCAAAAAAVLATPGHEGKTYDITGPDLISERDFAKMLTQVTGKSVRVVDIDDAAFVDRAVNNGTPEAFAKMGASFGTATRQNALNIKSEALQILIRRPPQSVRELLAQNKAQLLAPSASR